MNIQIEGTGKQTDVQIRAVYLIQIVFTYSWRVWQTPATG
jgi:hypothetical protein